MNKYHRGPPDGLYEDLYESEGGKWLTASEWTPFQEKLARAEQDRHDLNYQIGEALRRGLEVQKLLKEQRTPR